MAKQPKPWTPGQERIGTVATKVMSRVNTWMLRRSKGKFGKTLFIAGGAPVCLVTTTGVKSGQPRTVALLYMRDGNDIVIVASKGGMSANPQWYGNLVADPKVTIEVDGTTIPMIARTASPEEKTRLWPKLVEVYKGFVEYQARTERDIPVVICSPVAS
jgi:deazaflavin-dependent oxidoreductase (nitroreductase family)